MHLDGAQKVREAVPIDGLEAGRHRLKVVVTDGAGNQSDVQNLTIDVVGFTPVVIATDGIAMTGVHFSRVVIDTEGLIMTGVGSGNQQ